MPDRGVHALSERRVALATCAAFPLLAQDETLLLEALRGRGVAAEPEVWDDASVEWEAYDLVVVRSTWDYVSRRADFVAWTNAVPSILNAAEVIEWNTDKRYLSEVPHAIQTEFLQAPGEWNPPPGEYVVKPTVSAGSRDTARYGPGSAGLARRHAAELLAAGREVIVQPYLDSVDQRGETGLVFFAGRYSHAIRKGQMLHRGRQPASGLYVAEDIRPRQPSAAERAVAEEIIQSLPWARHELLYARVDLIAGADGRPRLIELELTEPSLFLSYSDGAAERLAGRVIERL